MEQLETHTGSLHIRVGEHTYIISYTYGQESLVEEQVLDMQRRGILPTDSVGALAIQTQLRQAYCLYMLSRVLRHGEPS